MKIIPSLLATLVLSSMISLPVFAAEQPEPITVLIDQQKLVLTNSNTPINDQGSIIVPFRAIFEKLGLSVTWDAKTKSITGSKEGLVIKLQVDSKKASVNDIVVSLATAPKVINNVTYVPLRFVGEATGNEVSWDAKQQAVIINKSQSVDPSEITAFFNNYVTYSNNENYEGFMSLIDPQSPIAQIGPQMKEQMEKFDVTTTIDQIEIIDLKANEATVHTIETSTKINGPFMLDNTTDLFYALTKEKDSSSWKISNLQINAIQYIVPEKMLTTTISVPKAEEEGILGVIQANLKSSNEENLEGVLSTIDDNSELLEQNKQVYTQIFQTFDFLFAIESTKIINYTENEAAVYMIQTTKKLKGPDFQDNRSSTVTTLKKSKDGKWKIDATYLIKIEPLTP